MSPAPAVPPGVDPKTGEITNEAHFLAEGLANDEITAPVLAGQPPTYAL